jgi:hypothetical protein
MTDLDRGLRELAGALEHPPTPDIAAAVAARLREGRPRRARRTRRTLIAVAIALLLPAGAIAAVPSVREFLGIAGVRVQRTPEPLPSLRSRPLDLGRPVAAEQAATLVSFAVVTPRARGLGAPDEAHHQTFPPGGALTFVYRSRPALTRDVLLLTEFRGSRATRFVGKLAGPGTTVERTTVGGEPAIWIAGRPHQFVFRDARGDDRVETLRLAGDTLLWQRGPLTLRLEGARSKAAALRIARSVR